MDNKDLQEYIQFQQCLDNLQILIDKRLCDIVAKASLQDDRIYFNRCAIVLRREYELRGCILNVELKKYVQEKLDAGFEEYEAVQRVFDNFDINGFVR